MITIHEHIAIAAPPERVWSIVSDPKQVVQCVEGARLGDELPDGALAVQVPVRFGPLRVRFNARVTLTFDEQTRTGSILAKARDEQGGTQATTTAEFVVSSESAGECCVEVSGQVTLAGKLASLIESSADTVIRRMVGDFTECIRVKACGPAVSAATDPIPPRRRPRFVVALLAALRTARNRLIARLIGRRRPRPTVER